MKHVLLRVSPVGRVPPRGVAALVLAVAAAVAAIAIAYFELRPKIQRLGRERDEFKRSSEQNRARAMKAETFARELSDRLAKTETQVDAALRESKRATEDNARLLIALEEARAQLHAAKQELARWNATGATPDQLASLVRGNKALAGQVAHLEAEKDRLAIDYAKLKRILDINFVPDAVPELPPMHGSVLVVDPKWNFVVLNLGETNGLLKNGVLLISRDGKLVAKVKIRRIEADRSIADILPGTQVTEVREGDRVMN